MHLAVVRESSDVPVDWLMGCVVAVAIQLQRDVAPAWGVIPPIVDGRIYPSFGAVPDDALPIVLLRDSDEAGALGYHDVQRDGRPYARVFTAGLELDDIACTLSHEAQEVLVDPGCDRWRRRGDGRLYALEISDPVEDMTYDVLGYQLSNFVLPPWFEDEGAFPVDFMGVLGEPWELSPGGYAIVQGADGALITIPLQHRARPEKQHAASRTHRRFS